MCCPTNQRGKAETTPLVIRSEHPFNINLLADYSNGTTTDVTCRRCLVNGPTDRER